MGQASVAVDQLRGRLAEYAADADDDTLTRLLHTTIEIGAVRELLIAVAAMGSQARRRVLSLPALSDADTLTHLITTTAPHHR